MIFKILQSIFDTLTKITYMVMLYQNFFHQVNLNDWVLAKSNWDKYGDNN